MANFLLATAVHPKEINTQPLLINNKSQSEKRSSLAQNQQTNKQNGAA